MLILFKYFPNKLGGSFTLNMIVINDWMHANDVTVLHISKPILESIIIKKKIEAFKSLCIGSCSFSG